MFRRLNFYRAKDVVLSSLKRWRFPRNRCTFLEYIRFAVAIQDLCFLCYRSKCNSEIHFASMQFYAMLPKFFWTVNFKNDTFWYYLLPYLTLWWIAKQMSRDCPAISPQTCTFLMIVCMEVDEVARHVDCDWAYSTSLLLRINGFNTQLDTRTFFFFLNILKYSCIFAEISSSINKEIFFQPEKRTWNRSFNLLFFKAFSQWIILQKIYLGYRL